jgi:hypothetical protein
MGFVEGLDYLWEPRRVNIVHRVIFPFSLFDAPLEEPVYAPITDMDRRRLVAILVEGSEPMADVVLIHDGQRWEAKVTAKGG